ncbi:MPT63 family protein [Mycolicibacterium llatzerense]|uniref:MPT63 family protein n=1 Tax=Mycolicibacterium llatzerense TaxID=280871 RepID=UPI0021B4F7B5|nr:MPT63 family protein [Mycolicibacterium llatzerense]MCT7366899.1 hypothetical protein [Mycolicibacterium llatzerense]
MKIKLVAPVGIAAIVFGMAGVTAGTASAANNIKPFGQQETLNEIGYTVKGLKPSSDPVPHNGQLYSATVTVEGLGGWANPIVGFFNARAESGANYRVIGGGVGSAPPGGTTTGKLYFDVVGDVPNSVVYNDGMQDLLVWVPRSPVGGVSEEESDTPVGTSEIISTPPAESAPAPAEVGTPTGGNFFAPEVVAPAPFDLSEADVASPGYNSGSGRR